MSTISAKEWATAYAAEKGLDAAKLADLVQMLETAGVTVLIAQPDPPKPYIPPYPGAPLPGDAGVRVYVISEDGGYMKVGVSDSPFGRKAQLQTANPRALSVIHESRPYQRWRALEIERSAHDQLAEYRVQGEWFDCGALCAVGAVMDNGGVAE